MKKLISGFVIAISILFVQSSSFAQSPPLFGPAKYTRTIGKPNTYQDAFQTCNASATYKLVVENGEGGKDRLSSASVSINGQEVVRENDFNQKTEKIEKTITLQSENTIDVKLASGPGVIKASIYCISGCLDIKIASPSDNSTVNRSKTLIQGSLLNVYGETGVTFQSSGASGQASVLAETQGNSFAGIAPLQQGQNIITAIATDACGYQAIDRITINTESIQEPIRLTVNTQSGILSSTTGNLEVSLEADANLPNPVSTYSWDTDGDGEAEQAGKDLSKITATYQSPGLYFPKVTITDSQNNTYTETAIINVLSKEQMDALLKSKWEGMTGAMGSGNIEKSLKYFVAGARDKYSQIFIERSNRLSSIFSRITEIKLYTLYGNVANCGAIRDENGKRYSYPVTFVRDENGIWKMMGF